MRHITRIHEYLKDHPASTALEIARDLDIGIGTVKAALAALKVRSLVTAEPCPDRARIILYSSVAGPADINTVLERARNLPGPFGILVAQVMA